MLPSWLYCNITTGISVNSRVACLQHYNKLRLISIRFISNNNRNLLSTTSSSTNGSTSKSMKKYFRGLQVGLKSFMGARIQPIASQSGKADHWKQWLKKRMVDGREHWKTRLIRKNEAELLEQIPDGMFKRMQFYFKRYWYIALPVHTICCLLWLGGLYLAVQSGVDVVSLLQRIHLPEIWVQKVQDLPKAAGSLAAALVLYKVFTPLRYACSLLGIRMVYKKLKNLGYLRTARQLHYQTRIELEALRKRLAERRKLAAIQNWRRMGRKGSCDKNEKHTAGT